MVFYHKHMSNKTLNNSSFDSNAEKRKKESRRQAVNSNLKRRQVS